MTYAHAVSLVENLLRNVTVLQQERERIDEALQVLKSAPSFAQGQFSSDGPNADDPIPHDDPNWPPLPEQKGPDGPM